VEIELLEDITNQIRSFDIFANSIECVARGFHREWWNFNRFAIRGSDGDAGCDDQTNVAESAQFFYHAVDILAVVTLWFEDRLRVIKDNENVPGG
jgi:hypothetical protein